MSNVQLEGLVWSVVSVSFGSPAFHLVSGGDVNRTIYKAGEQKPWQSLKPQPPLLVSWASRESLCNWQCLLEQWSKTAGNGRLDFPESTCWTPNGRDGIEISQLHSFDDSNVDRSDVLPWSPSPRANFLGKKSAFEVVDPENMPQTAMAATGCCVRCLGNDGVLLGFGSGEGSLVKSHMSFRFIMKHYQTWLLEFHDLIHACRSSKVLPINSCLDMLPPQRCSWPFHHLDTVQHLLWLRASDPELRLWPELEEDLAPSSRHLCRRLQTEFDIWSQNQHKETGVWIDWLTIFNHPNEQNLLAWQSGSSPRQLAPLNRSLGKWAQKHGKRDLV